MKKLNVLFLADTTHHTNAVTDHINAITSSQKINWYVLNPIINKTIDKLDLSLFDAIGIHYSIKPYNHYYLSKPLKEKLGQYKGFKFQFLQDEYQQVNTVQDFLYDLDIDVLFTLVGEHFLEKAYPDPRLKKLKKIPIMTGYVQDSLKNWEVPSIADRQIDVSYRARRYEYWLGSLAYEKQFIADEFLKQSNDKSLHLDISLNESDRLYGDAWFNLLKNSKAVLGAESGASIWDFDGSIEKETRTYLKNNKKATFNEVYENVLKENDNNILYNAISPRVFEAAATRTPMIMFPGEYSGVCKADIHYIKLEKDFSNIEEVLSKLKDDEFLENLANRTYEDLIGSGLYSQHQFSSLVEQVVLDNIHHAEIKQKSLNIPQQLECVAQKYKLLNLIRRFKTEGYFIISNFITLLWDPRYTFKTRLLGLYKGMKRYISYSIPRFRSDTNL